ncbi:HTTM domain-containing protein [Flavobacteriaceae bacterium F08102]|nr:HTTM domain-containing protein [Flavobacteriaceae bacterium F08102]
MDKFLYRHIDNAPLIVFRIIFGALLFLESIGAIFTGWVERNLINPTRTFTFIGFDFLQPLPGNGMIYYYIIMGLTGFCVMIGYRYRMAMISFFVLWSATYLMQKSSYNNHYYLTALLAFLMIFLPANKGYSVDAKLNPSLRSTSVPYWTSLVLIAQISIVYFYAGVAKIYPDWLAATPVKQFLASKHNFPLLGPLFREDWFAYTLSYAGLFFDLLIIPLFLYKKTRNLALILTLIFHLFNSIVFQIGIFPYLTLAFAVFFYDAKTIRNRFLPKKPLYQKTEVGNRMGFPLKLLFILYFTVQLLLPIRHWFIPGDVLWTEEGHRLSWRMMLRSKTGYQHFFIVNKENGTRKRVDLTTYLTKNQRSAVQTKPDMIWQFAQRLKKEYAQKGISIEVYVEGKVRINGGTLHPLIDKNTDLAAVSWHPFSHESWILTRPN